MGRTTLKAYSPELLVTVVRVISVESEASVIVAFRSVPPEHPKLFVPGGEIPTDSVKG